jgi:hypothetical protein
MGRAADLVERMVTLACARGFTRAQALQAIALASDEIIQRQAGNSSVNLPYMRAIHGEAMRRWRSTPLETSLPMRGQSAQRGKAE